MSLTISATGAHGALRSRMGYACRLMVAVKKEEYDAGNALWAEEVDVEMKKRRETK